MNQQLQADVVERLSVNQLIREFPETVAVFNDFGIDACCGGAASVEEAALRDGADPGSVTRALYQVIRRQP